MASVLIVDDLLSIHEMLDAVIQPTGFATAFATDGEKALARYKAERFDLVLADIDMKPMDGIKLLKHLKEYDHNAVVIIMTAYASTESAIQALKTGAFDYLQKPFRVDELIATLRRGIEFREFQLRRGEVGQDKVDEADIEARLIGASAVMTKLRHQVARLASARAPVLLQGELGTGKSTIAEILHANGADEGAELVRIDCALSTEANFTTGLLGENGAGGEWVERAVGGTLLLQNLQSLPLDLQPQLVSVLRNSAHRFRLICTSSEDLEQLTDEGRFHDELFYRVASLPVTAPPLRQHVDDLPAIIKHFLSRASNPEFDPTLIEFDEEAMAVLFRYRWPGNIAELQQMVRSIAAQTPSRIVSLAQIPLRQKSLSEWPSLENYLAGERRHYIEMVLRACRGDKGEAARVLGVAPESLG